VSSSEALFRVGVTGWLMEGDPRERETLYESLTETLCVALRDKLTETDCESLAVKESEVVRDNEGESVTDMELLPLRE